MKVSDKKIIENQILLLEYSLGGIPPKDASYVVKMVAEVLKIIIR